MFWSYSNHDDDGKLDTLGSLDDATLFDTTESATSRSRWHHTDVDKINVVPVTVKTTITLGHSERVHEPRPGRGRGIST